MVTKSRNYRNIGEELVQFCEHKFCHIENIFIVWRSGISPMRCRVSSPDNEVRMWLNFAHGCQGRLHQQEGRVTIVVAKIFHFWTFTISGFVTVTNFRRSSITSVTDNLVTEIGNVASFNILIVKVKIRNVPEESSITEVDKNLNYS